MPEKGAITNEDRCIHVKVDQSETFVEVLNPIVASRKAAFSRFYGED
jgi:hypothetical protein